MWIWPLSKPWEYTPLGYLLAIIWNCCELSRVKMPFAPWCFGKICGCKSKKINETPTTPDNSKD